MEKENRRVQMTKRMVKDALLRLLKDKDISKINISELCKEADINRATFYHHYQVPEDVVQDICWEYVKDIQDIFSKRDVLTLDERLEKLFIYLGDNKKTLKILFSSNADHAIVAGLTPMFAYAWENFSDLKSAVLPTDEIEAKLIINCHGWTAYFIIRQWIIEDIDKSPREMTGLLLRYFTNKLSSNN